MKYFLIGLFAWALTGIFYFLLVVMEDKKYKEWNNGYFFNESFVNLIVFIFSLIFGVILLAKEIFGMVLKRYAENKLKKVLRRIEKRNPGTIGEDLKKFAFSKEHIDWGDLEDTELDRLLEDDEK